MLQLKLLGQITAQVWSQFFMRGHGHFTDITYQLTALPLLQKAVVVKLKRIYRSKQAKSQDTEEWLSIRTETVLMTVHSTAGLLAPDQGLWLRWNMFCSHSPASFLQHRKETVTLKSPINMLLHPEATESLYRCTSFWTKENSLIWEKNGSRRFTMNSWWADL